MGSGTVCRSDTNRSASEGHKRLPRLRFGLVCKADRVEDRQTVPLPYAAPARRRVQCLASQTVPANQGGRGCCDDQAGK